MQIITDLDAIKELRRKLTEVLQDLRDQYELAGRAIDEIAETWKDEKFKKFKDQFEEDRDKLKPLCEKIEEYDTEVLDKVQRWIEDYLGL
jgi:gas vesicle protein